MSVINIVSSILSGKSDYCCLCFKKITEDDYYSMHDEVLFNTKDGHPVGLLNILNFILEEQVVKDCLTTLSFICSVCAKTAVNSYKFINMCKENANTLSHAVDTLNNCFLNTMEDINTFKSLFVMIDAKELTSIEYYDAEAVINPATALQRFKSIAKKRIRKPIKQKDKKPMEKKKKLHNFSADVFEICDVIREKNSPTQFKCKGCSNTFIKLFNFKKHYYSQHAPKILKCSECPRSYGSEALLKQHKYDCHTSIICSECGKTYNNRYSLLYHMRRHTGEHPYQCQYCGQKFQWSSRRAEHIRRFHMEPGVECDICHIKFRALGSLYDHRKRHFNPNSRLHVNQVIEEEIIL